MNMPLYNYYAELAGIKSPRQGPNNTFLILFVLTMLLLFMFIISKAKAETPLDIATIELGHGEIGGNNRGYYVRQYLNGQENLPWCAGFVSYCLRKSGVKVPYTLRAKDFLKLGKIVKNPQTGDIIVFSRKGGGGHTGLIFKVTNDKIITIEGNTGDFPSIVRQKVYTRNNIPNLLGFVRIEGS